jgi:arginase family enzyme
MTVAAPATRPAGLVALRCRISEPPPYARGVPPLAAALGSRLNTPARVVGSGEAVERRGWEQDLAAARGCLLEAGGQVEDALAAGRMPVLLHGDCSIAMTTLPAVLRHHPDARVLWLDAHGDFNTPRTSPSEWLGGMGLAGACGRWDPGLGQPPVDTGRLVMCGVRDLDPEERRLLEASSATLVGTSLETLVFLRNALDGAPVYVHLDPDVLDPSAFPAEFPAESGLTVEKLYDLLEAVATACPVVGLEVAAFYAPEDESERARWASLLADVVQPLLAEVPHGH